MSTTDERTHLVMRRETFNELWLHTQIPSSTAVTDGAAALRAALRLPLRDLLDGRVCVSCDAMALEFIRAEAPEIARLWPAVFGDAEVPRSRQLMSIAAHAIGQTVAGSQVYPDGALRLEFESGAALVVRGGDLDWRHGG